MTTYIDAASPSGNGRRITLLGTDLIFGGIDNVFVYPTLDIHRLQDALRQTLSSWPILTGRIIVENDDQYSIEFSDNSIPFTYTENDQLQCWPDLPVIVDDTTIIQPFIDSVQYKPEVEPLVRFKVTRLIQSDEYVLGTSVLHIVGDAHSCIHFLNDLSRIYQHLEPLLPRPIFERELFPKQDPDYSLTPIVNLIQHVRTKEAVLARIVKEQTETDPINMSFSSTQLAQLHQNNDKITAHDALCAYIILALNKYFFSTSNGCIRRAQMIVNYRGVSDTLAPKNHAANSFLQTFSSEFSDPLSLSSIAKTIRQAIDTIRNKELLEKWIIAADILMKQFDKDGRINFTLNEDEIIFNSNYKYDWANAVDFGMTNQCRFHTMGLFKFYCRIFRSNPMKDKDGKWIRDVNGAEVAFRMPKGEGQEKFLEGWKKDIEENFANVK